MNEHLLSRANLAAVKTYDEFFALCQGLRKTDKGALFDFLFTTALSGVAESTSAIAGFALIELEPKCPITCSEAIERISNSKWDLSNREVPFYLVSQFGKWTVQGAVNEFLRHSNRDEQQNVLVNGVWYWASGPSVKLAEKLFYWEWQEVIEDPNA